MRLPSFRFRDSRSRWTAIVVILLLIGLVLFFGGRYRSLRELDPKGGNLFIFFLININILLLTVLVFLLARNAIKLFYEGKAKVFGYHLRTRLVLIFVGFSLIPTILLFFVAQGFITDSIQYWFNLNVDQAVEGALSVSQDYYSTLTGRSRVIAQRVGERLDMVTEGKELENSLESLRKDYALSMVELFDGDGEFLARAWDGTSPQNFTDIQSSLVQSALVGRVTDSVTRADKGEYIRASAPLATPGGQGAVVVSIHLSEDVRQSAEAVASTYRGYTEMRLQEGPIKQNYLAYPRTSGFCRMGVANVLSITVTMPRALANSASADRSTTVNRGLLGDSTKIMRVSGLLAPEIASASAAAKLCWIPNRSNSLVIRAWVPPYKPSVNRT